MMAQGVRKRPWAFFVPYPTSRAAARQSRKQPGRRDPARAKPEAEIANERPDLHRSS